MREYRLADRRANGTAETAGRNISPRVWTKPTRVAVTNVANTGNTGNTGNTANTGNTVNTAPPPKADARQTTPAKQRPMRMIENEETSLTSPKSKDKISEILPRAPFLDRTNDPEKDSHPPIDASHLSPTKIITPRDGLLTPDRWAISRSPDRLEVPALDVLGLEQFRCVYYSQYTDSLKILQLL